MQSEYDALRNEIAALRERTPLKKGAKRKKVSYPDDIKARVVALGRRTDEPSQRLGKRLGLHGSLIRSWRREPQSGGFVPVQVATGAESTPVSARTDSTLALSWREMRVELPAGLGGDELRQLVAVLKEAVSC
jgi:transposase-like protein